MKPQQAIHWVTPTMMVAAFFVGCMLSLGHHLFYSSLAGTNTPTGYYHAIAGNKISKQELNTAIGTTFAFLVKAMLALAVSTAYMQAFWHSAKASKKGQRLSTLDTTFSILGNVLGFGKVHVWVKYPLLLFMAVVAWSIPIASIVAPATLSVQNVRVNVSRSTTVPRFDFTNYDFASPLGVGDPSADAANYTVYCYRGPGQVVERVAAAVAAQGQVLPITPPSLNATWNLDFWGPSLQCSEVEGQDREDIWASVWEYLDDGSRCRDSFSYLAWTPTAQTSVPFVNHSGSLVLQSNSLSINVPAAIYVAVIPEMFSQSVDLPTHTLNGGCVLWDSSNDAHDGESYSQALLKTNGTASTWFNNATLLQCQFLNTSFTANFNYTDGSQRIDISQTPFSQPQPLEPVSCVTGPISLAIGGGDFVQGFSNMANASCSTLNLENKQCEFDPSLVRLLAYQSIADSFGKLVQGSVGLGGHALPYPEVTYNSNIAQTVLLDTNELSFIQTWTPNNGFLDLATLSEESNGTSYLGLSDKKNFTSRGPLAKALEDLFQNITLSLLSEQYLQPNYSSPYAPTPKANVTFTSYHNVYIYNSRILWIAYGLAIGFTSIAVAIGIAALLSNGSAYSNNFSTVLRIKKTMSEEILENEGDGSEPLPKRLAKARVLLGDGGEQLAEKASVSSSVTLIDQPEATAYSSLLRTNTRRTL